MLALSGHKALDPKDAEKAAQQALAVSPLCPEAHNVLALRTSTNLQQALAIYSAGEEVGMKCVKAEVLAAAVKDKNAWRVVPLRGVCGREEGREDAAPRIAAI